jgi:hypothetical protein
MQDGIYGLPKTGFYFWELDSTIKQRLNEIPRKLDKAGAAERIEELLWLRDEMKMWIYKREGILGEEKTK